MSRTVIITGASGGIGKETALLFARKGWNVAVVYFGNMGEAENIVNLIKDNGGNAVKFCCDIKSKKETDNLVSLVKKTFGKIDALVNNAGVAIKQKPFDEVTTDEYDYIFDVNARGTSNCIQSVLPEMIHNKCGKIVNISSVWGVCGGSCEVAYSASKSAIIGMTKALSKELAPSGINVNCVAPGVIDTKMNSHLDENSMDALKEEIPLGRIGTGCDVAECIYFLCDTSSDYITGQVISVDGGMSV